MINKERNCDTNERLVDKELKKLIFFCSKLTGIVESTLRKSGKSGWSLRRSTR